MVSLIVLALCLFTVACGSTTSKGDTDCDPDEEDCGNTTDEPTDSTTEPTTEPTDSTTDPTTEPSDEPTEPTEPTTETDCENGDDTISKIQKGETNVDADVTTECIVTGIYYKEDEEHNKTAIQGLYVSEIIKQAEPYTGIYVFIKDTATVNDYKVGDKLEVKGIYKEHYENSQIEASDIKKLGSCPLPKPAEIADPATIATPYELAGEEYSPTANHGADAEKYEGVLVKVKDVKITNSNLGHGAFEVTGNLAVSKDLYYYNGSRNEGVKFNSIAGILTYSFEAFQLAPRSYEDFDVKIEKNAKISAIQKGEITTGSTVEISESVVTAIAYKQDSSTHENTAIKGLYISEIISQAEPYTGIYVFIKGTAPVNAYAIGDKLKITGTVEEYYDSTQISVASEDQIDKLGTAAVPAPAEINDSSKISTPYTQNGEEWEPTTDHGTDAEKYESVLVKVKNVEVTNNNLGHGTFEVTGNLAISKDLYYYPGDRSIGVEFNSISGILIYSYSAFQLAPRSGDDIVAAAGD